MKDVFLLAINLETGEYKGTLDGDCEENQSWEDILDLALELKKRAEDKLTMNED